MEILEANSKLLSNYDAYILLKSVKTELDAKKRPLKNHGLSTVVYECVKALETCKDQSDEGVKEFLRRIKETGLGLTKAETLQLLNSAPQTPEELRLYIEEAAERLQEADEDLLLQIIAQTIRAAPENSPVDPDLGENFENGDDMEEE